MSPTYYGLDAKYAPNLTLLYFFTMSKNFAGRSARCILASIGDPELLRNFMPVSAGNLTSQNLRPYQYFKNFMSFSGLAPSHCPYLKTSSLTISYLTTICLNSWSYGDSNPGPPACKAGALAS